MADPFSFAISTVAQIGVSFLFPSEGPRLKDLKVSSSTYGNAIPWVWGVARVPGNMIWGLNIKEKKVEKYSSGKGGFYNNYTYSCTFAMGLCRGPIDNIRRIWADGKIIFDATGQSIVQNQSKYQFRFYYGDEEQLPDSSMIADKGVGNTPAYRGLAYILFQDMPLGDFGNRIPQITAEVLGIGGDPSGAVTPTDATTVAQGIATTPIVDWARGYYYSMQGDNIVRYRISDGGLDRIIYNADMGFAPGDVYYELPGAKPGACAVLSAICQDGSLIVESSGGNTDSLHRLDPLSYEIVASFGRAGASLGNDDGTSTNTYTGTGFVAGGFNNCTALDSQGTEYFFHQGLGNCIGILRTADMSYVWGAGQVAYGVGGIVFNQGPSYFCGRDPDNSGLPTFYGVSTHNGTASYIIKVQPSSSDTPQDVVFTYNDPTMYMYGVWWDSAIPGVLYAFHNSAGSFVAKWSEDTQQEAWRLQVPGPPALTAQSKILNGNMSWVYGGAIYSIDTATGTWLNNNTNVQQGDTSDPFDTGSNIGQPDWDAYLALYPQVLQGYEQSGRGVADTPEGYAQWQYYNIGRAQGFQLPLIGQNAGAGIVLPAPYNQNVGYCVYNSTTGQIVSMGGLNGVISLASASGETNVATVVSRMLDEGGLPPAQYDLAVLEGMVFDGYGFASSTDVKGIIDELKKLFLFDLVETQGQLVAVARSTGSNGDGTSVVTIPQDLLGSSSPTEADFWKETRIQEADLPAQVSLTFMDVNNAYQATVARSARVTDPVPTVLSRQQVAMEINIAWDATNAKNQTNQVLYEQWAQRTRHDTSLPWAYLYLDPSDLITVNMNDGRVYNERIHETEIGADFAIKTQTYGYNSGAYNSNMAADGGGGATVQTIAQPQPAIPFILNTPLLRDADDTGGSFSRYYAGVGNGGGGTFTGAAVQRSTNNLDFSTLFTETNDVEWGSVVGTVPTASRGWYALDWETQITIWPAVSWFDLQSCSDDDLWAGANPCAIGNGQLWEIIQFRDCVKNANGSWTISNLLRGRRGTEYAIDTHQTGERFVFLNTANVDLEGDTLDSTGQARFFKALGDGMPQNSGITSSIIYQPRDLMPYAPTDIRRAFGTPVAPATSADITLTWSRRTRLGGNMMDGTGVVPLAETSEAYEVYILPAPFSGDPSTGAAPVLFHRMYPTTSPTVTYPVADQTADGYVMNLDTLYVAIYQISSVAGRGFPGCRAILPTAGF